VIVQKGSTLRVTGLGFEACKQNCEKRLLVSSSVSLSPSARVEQSAFSGRILIEFDFLGFFFQTL
jgi:hypothetical protein